MPLLTFLPWCKLERPVQVGRTELLVFEPDSALEVNATEHEWVRTILARYHELDAQAVRRCAVLRFDNRPLLDELDDDAIESTREDVVLACFASLAAREFSCRPYSNATCFNVYGQRFSTPPEFIALTARRRDGRTLSAQSLNEATFSIPIQASVVNSVSVDEPLLQALLQFRAAATAELWSRWFDAVLCFNHANTDDDAMPYQIEAGQIVGAFERLLDADSTAFDIATKFTSAFTPLTTVEVATSRRSLPRWKTPTAALRHEWLREFYIVRGNFAHGTLDTIMPLEP